MPKVIPELVVSNTERSREFYTMLGFVQDNKGILDDKGQQWYSLAMGDATVWVLREDTVEGYDTSLQRGPGVRSEVERAVHVGRLVQRSLQLHEPRMQRADR